MHGARFDGVCVQKVEIFGAVAAYYKVDVRKKEENKNEIKVNRH
jgi:hypothetical protein